MDIRELLSSMVHEVHVVDGPSETIQRIAHYARVAVDADDSGIMLVKARGRIETPAGTSDTVVTAHRLQAELDEGPCLAAIRGGDLTYVTGDAATDPRWPTWGPRVAELGYHSVISIRLETGDRKYGSLNSYATRPNAFSVEDTEVMELLGAHASVAIAASITVGDLHTALDSRSKIGQAQGILMAVYDLDAEGAFQHLRRLSMEGNTRLAEVCDHVIAQRHELRKQID